MLLGIDNKILMFEVKLFGDLRSKLVKPKNLKLCAAHNFRRKIAWVY